MVGVWLSPGKPPYLGGLGVIATPADVRSIPWFAMKYGCTGLFLPEVLHWSGDIFQTTAGAETRLFYPGKFAGLEGVLPSVRLKRLRRGLQDIAYLWLLQQRDRRAVAATVMNAMTRYAGLDAAGDNYLDPRLNGWVQDGDTWEIARRLLAEEVVSAVHPSAAYEHRLTVHRLAWKQFNAQTHIVRVEQIRSRITAADLKGGQRRLRATVLLDLFNEHGRRMHCQVKIDELPPGWKDMSGPVEVSPFLPASRRVVTLIAEGGTAPVGPNAKLSLPVSITAGSATQKRLTVHVPFLLAGHANSPPKIDGKLEDWPGRFGNCAGDFKLIGRRGQKGTGLAKRQTLAFVLYDDKNLYIGFRCREPTPDKIHARTNNLIHYEQLMACGEDLVEILLDPGADAKGPSDLYHIVVKPNGVLVAERGVRTRPPLGLWRPWPVGATVAVGRSKDHWIVELAIPRRAFGAEASRTVWGVNFTRFATCGSEASSWSEAPRYFYDPKNLGTMFLPPSGTP